VELPRDEYFATEAGWVCTIIFGYGQVTGNTLVLTVQGTPVSANFVFEESL
jgi:hypothetical protein